MSPHHRILVTGASGFVAPHVARALRDLYADAVTVVGTALHDRADPDFGTIIRLDVTDRQAVRDAIVRYMPSHVVNLAAIAAPRAVSADPATGWQVHLDATRNIAEAILDLAPYCVLVHVGSGLVYGDSAVSGLPLGEHTVLAPTDDYGASKAAADLALGAFAAHGLKCVRFRPFNHTGPGQTQDFVIPAFAMQIARIEMGLIPPVMRVGNLEPQRDFLDVRDVADAYVRAIEQSDAIAPGLILNIASGIPRRISTVLETLLAMSTAAITVEIDPERAKASGLSLIVGDATRARDVLGWAPRYAFETTIADVLNDCRARLR